MNCRAVGHRFFMRPPTSAFDGIDCTYSQKEDLQYNNKFICIEGACKVINKHTLKSLFSLNKTGLLSICNAPERADYAIPLRLKQHAKIIASFITFYKFQFVAFDEFPVLNNGVSTKYSTTIRHKAFLLLFLFMILSKRT